MTKTNLFWVYFHEVWKRRKKYENIVKSIQDFFDNFSDKKLILPKDINLSEMSLKTLKRTLNELKSKMINELKAAEKV